MLWQSGVTGSGCPRYKGHSVECSGKTYIPRSRVILHFVSTDRPISLLSHCPQTPLSITWEALQNPKSRWQHIPVTPGSRVGGRHQDWSQLLSVPWEGRIGSCTQALTLESPVWGFLEKHPCRTPCRPRTLRLCLSDDHGCFRISPG